MNRKWNKLTSTQKKRIIKLIVALIVTIIVVIVAVNLIYDYGEIVLATIIMWIVFMTFLSQV